MLILSRKEVERLIELDKLPAIIEEAFYAYAIGEASMPPKIYLDIPQHNGDFRAMPAYFRGAAGLKWVCVYPLNPSANNLPTVMGMLFYNDPTTGQPLAVMEASALTGYRTAAASAVAIKYLARPDAGTLGIIGCGGQARTHLEVLAASFSFSRINVFDTDRSRALALKENYKSLPIEATSLEETCSNDILCALTPARKPVIESRFIKPGAHINAIGADAAGKQELEIEVLKRSRVFVDDLKQSMHSGEINVAISSGEYKQEELAGSLGDVIANKCPGRRTKDEITVFDSTGLAIQDIALAKYLYQRAATLKAGYNLDLL